MVKNSHPTGTPELLFEEAEPCVQTPVIVAPVVKTEVNTAHDNILRAIDMPRRDLEEWEIDDTVSRPHVGR